MKQTALFQLSCKIFGLYFIVRAVESIKDLIVYGGGSRLFEYFDDSVYFMVGQFGFDFTINVLAAWLLLSRSENLTARLLKREGEPVDLDMTKADLIELVVIAISGLVIIHAIPVILGTITHFMYFNPYDRYSRNEFWTNNEKTKLIYAVFRLITGIVVITNARLITRKLTRIGDKDEVLDKA